MPELDLSRALRIGHMGHEVAQMGHLGQTIWTAAAAAPVIAIASGSGYAGSVYSSTVAGQWTADGVAIAGATGTAWTMTAAYEGKAIRCGGSNVIRMWTPAALNSSYKTNGVWLSFDKGATLAAGKIAAAADLFGVRPYSQATATAQFTASTINGHLAGVVNGNGQTMAPADAFAPLWWAVVAGWKTGIEPLFPTWNHLLGTGNTRDGILGTQGGAALIGGSGFFINGTATATLLPTAKSIVAVTPTAGGTAYKWQLGLGRLSTWVWSGPIYEALALGVVPDTTTRQQIEGYLAHVQGLSSSLPADHPYRTNAPRIA